MATLLTHSYVRHDSFICETWLIHWKNTCSKMAAVSSSKWWLSWLICETCLIHTWDMTHLIHIPAVKWRRGSLSRWWHSWLIHMWDMTPIYVRRDSFIEKMPAVKWRQYRHQNDDSLDLYVRHDSFISYTCSKMAAVSSSRWWLSWNSRSNSARSCTICRHT